MSDTLRSTFRRVLRLENRRAAIRPGRLERIPEFQSKIVAGPRMVTVYLPAGYDERQETRYPVLYMHDGQNLFDADRAYVPGNHWRLQDAADAAVGDRTASPFIIVGIDHGGPARIDEYTPTRSAKHNGGGRAADHARMLIEELKPMIDERFRTQPGETAVGGSSLGGLVSLFLVLARPDVFSRAAVMSPSVWWGDRAILDEIDRLAAEHGDAARPRMWLDIGGREGTEALRDARALRTRLVERGWNDETLHYFEDRRADHSERAWAKRVRKALEFLFPPS